MSILHVTNGDCARELMERSGIPGTVLAWPDVLHDGPTPLLTGEPWIQVRSRYLAAQPGESEPDEAAIAEMARQYREGDAVLESYAEREELVFWFEHDLFDQLLLIRHLWWLRDKVAARTAGATRFSLVCRDRYLGLLPPEAFPPLFAERAPITPAQIDTGTRAWTAFCNPDPMGLVAFAAAEHADHPEHADYAELPYLPAAIRRHLEEFPSTTDGLARSERQILQVLSEGTRTPDEAFIEASRLEERIYMGDLSFGMIVRRLTEGTRPLVTADVQQRPGRLPDGTLALTEDGAAVLAGYADQIALNGVDRWLGGVRVTSDRLWRWTGTSLLPPAS
jgi:uncharacterized protein DUF1835